MRKFDPLNLSNIVGGILSHGLVLASTIFRQIIVANNPGLVTLTTPAWTTLTGSNLGTVEVGDWIVGLITLSGVKGGVAGPVTVRVTNTGASAINFYPGRAPVNGLIRKMTAGPGADGMTVVFGGEVTTRGTCTLLIEGLSTGSDFAVSALDAGSMWMVFANS